MSEFKNKMDYHLKAMKGTNKEFNQLQACETQNRALKEQIEALEMKLAGQSPEYRLIEAKELKPNATVNERIEFYRHKVRVAAKGIKALNEAKPKTDTQKRLERIIIINIEQLILIN